MPTNERDRTNARGITTRAEEKRTTRNVTTTSVDERTDTNSLPRTGNRPTTTNERDRTNARGITTKADEIRNTTIHGTNTPDNTHITMTHVGFNAKGFKQSFMYVSELLSHADTVGITETWLRPGELSVIKPTLLGTPALNNVNADDLVIFAKSGMCNIDPSYTGRPYGGVAVACRTKENIVYTEIPIENDRVIGVKVLNNSDIVEILLYVYMPFYNGDISQTELYLEATDVLQSVIDEYAAVSPIHIIGDLNVRLPIEQMLHKNWYKKGGYNRHSNIMYHFINDNGLNVTDISSKQDVNYTYFCDATATYTWIDHCLSTSHDITFDCKILPRHADNVSDHLPIRLQTSVLCNRSQSVEHTVNTQCPQVTHPWDNHGYTNTYRNTLETKLIEIQKLSCNRETDDITANDAIDAYMDQLNCAMRDSAVEAGCYSKQHVKPKRYWCPELSKLRDRKRFWWNLWVDNGRPREGSVFSVYKDVKKAFRRRSRYHVANQSRNEHYKLYEMIKARDMTGFWNVITRRRSSIQVKSSLTASDFNSFYGDVMQALPDSSQDQICDKKIVDTYYLDNCQTMKVQTIDAEQVNKFIIHLKSGKAPGLDGIYHEHLIFGNSEVLCASLASLYTGILSTAYVRKLFTTGVIIPVIKKSTLDPNVVKNYRPITISSVHTKAIESFIIPSAEISDNQFGFRENRGTAFACNLLNDVTSYCKSRNSSLFLATLDAEKCFDSICHVSLFLKLIDVLPTHQWLLLYNWYRKLNAVVKWNGCYSTTFNITRGTRQGSKLSPYLFNIFINQLLLDMNDCDAGVRIGDVLYNSMAYADDITIFSTNAKGLQCLIDMCAMYSNRWRFKYGIDKSKCMIIGKSPFTCEPVWRLNDVRLRNVETMEILGNVFNSKGNNTSHVDNRLNKCRQSFYGLNSLGMSYPGAAPEVQAHLYKSICQPVLTYGMECMSYSKDQFRRMESTQGRLIKQCLGLSKSSHNTAMLKALNIDKVQNIVNRNVLNLYHRIFRIESPARSIMQFLLARYITYGTTVPGTLIDRVVSIGESPLKCVFRKSGHKISILKDGIDGHADSIRLLLNSRNYVNRNSEEHFMVRLLTTAM